MDAFDAAIFSVSSVSQQMAKLLADCERAIIDAAEREGMKPLSVPAVTRAHLGGGRRVPRRHRFRLRFQVR